MKKIFTITALAAAMIAAATSCQKEQFAGQNDNPQIQGEGLVFYATLEDTDTRTTISNEGTAGYKISWETTDSISVNGTIYKAVPDKFNRAFATFTKMRPGDPDPKAPFKAYYPASIYDGTSATLPATQTYTADGSIASILPMYAEGSDIKLNFKNLCGLMKFTLKGTEKVQNITISDETKPLSGKFTVSGNAAVLDGAAKGGVTLNCGAEGVQLDEATGKTFYVAVPAGSYSNLHIEYNTVNYAKYAKMKANATATVERNKVYPFSQTPTFTPDLFYFEAVEAGATIGMLANGKAPTVSLQYSTDGGESWNIFTVGSTTVTLSNVGDRVYFKANGSNTNFGASASNYNRFNPTKQVNVGGNIMYLLNSAPTLSLSVDWTFVYLFYSTKISSASDLKLPATTLAENCYRSMFFKCTSLVNAPATLPATTLTSNCYYSMFQGCTALVNAPALPATTLASSCYRSMFQGCTALVNAPALPATTLASSCYYSMLQGCTALVNAPALPATTLTTGCYNSLFKDCKNLVNAPALPATTLADGCYYLMFNSCRKLSSVTMLATNVSAKNCTTYWLDTAGTDESITSRTVYVASGMVDAVKAIVPDKPDWKTGVQVKP